MIYVACPYTSDDDDTVSLRVDCIMEYSAMLLKSGQKFFSPISHSHEIDIRSRNGVRHQEHYRDRWLAIDLEIMKNCVTELHVLTMPGWKNSYGVTYEIEYAKHRGIPVYYLNVTKNDGVWSYNLIAGTPQ
jgi:hypothetical protein